MLDHTILKTREEEQRRLVELFYCSELTDKALKDLNMYSNNKNNTLQKTTFNIDKMLSLSVLN